MKNFLRERVKTTENLTLIALLAAINAIFSLFSYFIPIGGLILMLLLPVTGVIFARCCKLRFIPIYIFGSLGVSILVTFFDFASTIFYVLPALLIGTIYGLFSKAKFPTSITIFVTSLINILFIISSYYLITAFINIDLLGEMKSIINLPENVYEKFGFSILFIYSLSEICLSHIFVMIIGEKMDFIEHENPSDKIVYFILSIFTFILSIFLSFISSSTSILLMFFCLYFSTFLGLKLFESNKAVRITFLVLLGVSILSIPIIASFNIFNETSLIFLILCVSTILSEIVDIIYTIYKNKKEGV